MDPKVNAIALLSLFITGWEEESRQTPGEKITRSWKGYLFESLNSLEEQKMIRQFNNTKSCVITPEGVAEAKRLQNIIFSALDQQAEIDKKEAGL